MNQFYIKTTLLLQMYGIKVKNCVGYKCWSFLEEVAGTGATLRPRLFRPRGTRRGINLLVFVTNSLERIYRGSAVDRRNGSRMADWYEILNPIVH
jgi:hypothetical protein